MKMNEHALPEELIKLIIEAMQSKRTKEDFIKFIEEEKKKRGK